MNINNLNKRRAGSIIIIIVFVFVSTLVCGLSGCGLKQPVKPLSETRLLLDTVCTVTVYDPADEPLISKALNLCAEYEDLLSRTIEGSDIWRINHAKGEPVTVTPGTAEVIQAGLEFGVFSGGLFDITIGRVSVLWDFTGNPAVPSPEALAEAVETVDYMQVSVKGDTVQLADPDAWLDLGGIAKGFIADQLAQFLKDNGVKSAVINLGGNVVTVGTRPDGDPWHIAIDQPFSDHTEVIGVISCGEASIVTSGIYERQFTENGVLYHHILDPKTGLPSRSDVISATVVSESSTVGDAFSTIVILVGSDGTRELYDQVPGLMGVLLMLESGEIIQLGDINFEAGN